MASMQAGACGVMLRTEAIVDFGEALVMTAVGLRYVSKRASELMHEALTASSYEPLAAAPHLPERRAEIFHLLGEGFATREIAGRLGISLKTVQTHIGRLKEELGACSQAELYRRALLAARDADGASFSAD